MPFSNPDHIPAIIHLACAVQPLKILDVGIGMGAYGFLLRQYLDIAREQLNSSQWRVRIDGIEVFEGYRNPVWDYAYDQVLIGDVRDIIPSMEPYDLILMADVLEHFDLPEARRLIAQSLKRARVVIASTPNREHPQGAWAGNEAERHHCLLSAADFPQLVVKKTTGITTCYVSCSDDSLIPTLRDAGGTCPSCRVDWRSYSLYYVTRKWRGLRRRMAYYTAATNARR
jgi:hypothetical protein